MNAPRITVVIPTWNRWELLQNCLDSLFDQSHVPRILVVDNGSSDGTREKLRNYYPPVQVLGLTRNLGFARAVNLGLQRVHTPYVALLNNDTVADREWVAAGLEALQSCTEYGFFASRMLMLPDRSRLDSAGDLYGRTGLPLKRGNGEPADRYLEREEVLGASAGAAFYRMELFRRVGGFDEDFHIYLEDVEWSLRARLFGYRCLYLPEAVVYHWEAASDPDRKLDASATGPEAYYSSHRVYWITRNRWLLMVLYQCWCHAPWLLYGWLRSLGFHLFKAGHVAAFLRGLAAGVRATPEALRKRRRIHREAELTGRQLCKLLATFS